MSKASSCRISFKPSEGKALAFQARKEVSSMIVDCTISCPGKTPHVTALTASFGVFVRKSPCKSVVTTSVVRDTNNLVGCVHADHGNT